MISLQLDDSSDSQLSETAQYEKSRMVKFDRVFLFHHCVMLAVIIHAKARCNSRKRRHRTPFNNDGTVCRSIVSIGRGFADSRLATCAAYANGLLAGWLVLRESQQELSNKSATA